MEIPIATTRERFAGSKSHESSMEYVPDPGSASLSRRARSGIARLREALFEGRLRDTISELSGLGSMTRYSSELARALSKPHA